MQTSYIGIVGGMGPEAGVALSRNIICHTIAGKDQDHLPQILYSIPTIIPDRTDFLMGKVKTNPGLRIAGILADMDSIGVRLAALACNSAHAPKIFDVIMEEITTLVLNLKLLHMIEEVGRFLNENYPDKKKVGILGTTGTYMTRQYDILTQFGFETINISEKEQNTLHQAIYNPDYGIKSTPGKVSGMTAQTFENSCISLIKSGAGIIVLGCTELPQIFSGSFIREIPIIDSSVVLARALIKAHSPGKLKPWQP